MYFQNPFTADFRGSLSLADRQHSLTFVCPRHSARSDEAVHSFATGPFNLTGNDGDGGSTDTLILSYSLDVDGFKNWTLAAVNISGLAVNPAAVTTQEIVASMNADVQFSGVFRALLDNNRVVVQQKQPATRMKFFVVNGRAESVLRFNARAGVAELPSYFNRHTIARRADFEDSVGMLVLLDPVASVVHSEVIAAATGPKGLPLALDPGVVQPDWALLRGRSGLFQFTKVTGGTKIVYPAGAREGDFAMMIVEDGGNRFEMPYTLTADDLIIPA